MYLVPKKYEFESMLDTFFNDEKRNKCDIFEQDGKYFLELDMPGFKKENIKIEFKDGYLSISATDKEEINNKDKKYIRKERRESSIARQFYLGNIDGDNITAKVNDGILQIMVPKKDSENRKIIEIQ